MPDCFPRRSSFPWMPRARRTLSGVPGRESSASRTNSDSLLREGGSRGGQRGLRGGAGQQIEPFPHELRLLAAGGGVQRGSKGGAPRGSQSLLPSLMFV
eukprot:1191690-Prorocentrum_minimum.AAC.3